MSFTHRLDVVRALKRMHDAYDPRTTSLMAVGGVSDPHSEPFRAGFISHFEERTEVARRLELLEPKERRLLVLWHVEGHAVTQIARKLGISRVHCYRLERKALDRMLDRRDEREVEVPVPA